MFKWIKTFFRAATATYHITDQDYEERRQLLGMAVNDARDSGQVAYGRYCISRDAWYGPYWKTCLDIAKERQKQKRIRRKKSLQAKANKQKTRKSKKKHKHSKS